MLAFTCILLVAVFGFSRADESEESVLFHSWKQEHKKIYDNKDEERIRFQNFKANLEDIRMRNLQSQKEYGKDGAVFGINEFSDLSFEEFSQRYLSDSLPKPKAEPLSRDSVPLKARDVPPTVDWRNQYLTPIKNQGQCGSCWAFSCAELAESTYLWAGKQIQPLSPQQLVDCSTSNGLGCAGQAISPTLSYIQYTGLVTDAQYPYYAVAAQCNQKALVNNTKYKIYNYGTVTLSLRPESLILDTAASRGPIILFIAVDRGLQSYKSGILRANQCYLGTYNGPSSLNHMVQVAGWNLQKVNNNSLTYWNFRNSWGTRWGENGFFRLAYGENACHINNGWAYYATLN